LGSSPRSAEALIRKAFTLVELMIVVAIIGILASIAVPNFVEMQYRAKRSESDINVRGIATAQVALEASQDMFVTGSSNPGGSITKQTRAWDRTKRGWDTLGWEPDGEVRCNYTTRVLSSRHDNAFRVSAACDIDNDNQTYTVRFYGHKPGAGAAYWTVLYPQRY
jgi:prepilin-type N-terminal cleavage/methylation domain-containing protein